MRTNKNGQRATLVDPSTKTPKPPVTLALPAPYEDLGLLAYGAMGEIRRVRELGLNQVLAMKICTVRGELEAQRFQVEARAMAKLRHPGILVVHGQGTLPDGRSWFTTREVVGQTMRQTIEQFHASEEYKERRFVEIVETIASAAEAVGFAHRHNVFHRDLKPENIMIGVHGDVVVVDWGLSLLSLGVDDEPVLSNPGYRLNALGTPGYMSPEQANNQRSDPARSDVFSLGACLFDALQPQALDANHWVSPPPETNGLLALAGRALSTAPNHRPKNGSELARAIRLALATRTRRIRALQHIARANQETPTILAHRTAASRFQNEATQHLLSLGPRAATTEKAIGWQLEEQAHRESIQASVAETRYIRHLQSALNEEEGSPEAHAMLASTYKERMEIAERQRNDQDIATYELLLRSHDRAGEYQAWLTGTGLFRFLMPPNTKVKLLRYEVENRILHPKPFRRDDTESQGTVRLSKGSYVAIYSDDNGVVVHYPFVMGRDAPWRRTPPAACEPVPVSMPRHSNAGVCHVPAGWFPLGGDDDAVDGFPGRTIWVDTFAIQRHPVTFGAYLDFINALASQGECVEPLIPAEGTGVADKPRRLLLPDGNGRYQLGQTGDGRALTPEMPVVQVDWHSAQSYAAWLAADSGVPWRLLHELEWEKAARGVDRRVYPWGDHLDPTWTCMLLSHEGPAHFASVGAYETDTSPYGVSDMGGNIREWCLSDYTKEAPEDGSRIEITIGSGEYRMIRGGSWSSAANFCRSACRFAAAPSQRLTSLGFRLGYTR